MGNSVKRVITAAIALTLCLSVSTAFAERAPNTRTSLDKASHISRFEAENKEAGYDDFYKKSNPADKNFSQKFVDYSKKLDKLNKKYKHKGGFDLNKITKSKDILNDSSIGAGNGIIGNGSDSSYHNGFNPLNCNEGDILLVNNPGFHIQGSIQHVQMMDSVIFNNNHQSFDSKCEVSAEPDLGVILETPNQTRSYKECYVCYVPNLSSNTYITLTTSIEKYLGKKYLWCAPKSSNTNWYCSKVPYRAYMDYAKVNIDADDGYWCLPVDILNSDNVKLAAYYSS